jgi:hypothetical protein
MGIRLKVIQSYKISCSLLVNSILNTSLLIGSIPQKGSENIMSEKEKKIIRDLADKLPTMTERERGYLEGTIATAAAMSKKGEKNAADADTGNRDTD